MKFPETTERFVAYFDIMGFKDLIYRNDHSAVADVMRRVSAVVADLKDIESANLNLDEREITKDINKGVVLPVLFSDSILFVSYSNTIFDARKVAYVASYFLYNMIRARIPVKGALCYGTFTANFKASEFFGRPLVDAFLLADETYFYGAILHHSFEEYLHTNNELIPEILLKRKSVPMKGGAVTHSFIDRRFHVDDKDARKSNSLIEPFYRSISGSTRKYVDNTASVYTENL